MRLWSPLSPRQPSLLQGSHRAVLRERWLVLAALAALAVASPARGETTFRCAGFESPALATAGAAKGGTQQAVPSRGSLRALAIYAGFSDEAAAQPTVANSATTFFDPAREGSFSHYYATMSFGQLTVTGTVLSRRFGATERAHAYVGGLQGQRGDYGRYVAEVLAQADQVVDFRQFDNDGPDGVPDSGDDDGIVDYVFVIAHSTPAGFIVGHATGISGLGFPQEIATADMGRNGRPIRLVSTPGHGSLVAEGSYGQTVGVMAHEFGHALGLPDLYDLNYDGPEEDSAGIGRWGLMGWGAHGWSGAGPEPLCAWSLERLGWLGRDNERLVEVTSPRTGLPARDLFQGGSVYKVYLPATPRTPKETASSVGAVVDPGYLLLEWRTRQGSVYGRDQPGEGLLVWQVHPNLTQNNDERHKVVDLVCADGLREDGQDDLDLWAHDDAWTAAHGGNQGDAGDPFDGVTRTELSLDTDPSVRSLGAFGEAAQVPLLVRVRRQGNDGILTVDPPRWAGTITGDVCWAGVVVVDGDLTVAPSGALVLYAGTEVRVAPADRLHTGADADLCEVRVQGCLQVANAIQGQVHLHGLSPGGAWYGMVVEPAEGSGLFVPEGSLAVEDATHGVSLPEMPDGVAGLVLRTAALVDSGQAAAAGNGDGVLQPGESVQVVLELANWSLTTQSKVQVTTTWADSLLTATWSATAGVSRRRTQMLTLVPGERQQISLPQLTLSPEAQPGQTRYLEVQVRAGKEVQVTQVPLAVGKAAALPEVRFTVGDGPATDSLMLAAREESLPLRLEAPSGGVERVEVVAYDPTLQRVAAEVPLAPTDRSGTVFSGTFSPSWASLELAARVHTDQGSVFLAPNRVAIETPFPRWEPALVVWTPTQQRTLKAAVDSALARHKMTANSVAPLTLSKYGPALLNRYLGPGHLVLVLSGGSYLGYGEAIADYLDRGGRLVLAARSLSGFPDQELLSRLGAQGFADGNGELKLADGSASLPGPSSFNLLSGMAPETEPMLVTPDGGVAGIRRDTGEYRCEYLSLLLPGGTTTAALLKDAVDWLLTEATARRVVIHDVLGLPRLAALGPIRPRVVLTNPGEEAIGPMSVSGEVLAAGQPVARLSGRVASVPAGQARTVWMPLWRPAEEQDYLLRFTATGSDGRMIGPVEKAVRMARVTGRFEEVPLPAQGKGNGVAAFDADNDGDLDLLVVRQGVPNLLLRHDGGSWSEVGAEAGVVDGQAQGRGAAVGDWDGDGDLDLYLVSQPASSPTAPAKGNRLLANRGDGRFDDVTAAVDSASAGAAVLADPGSGRSAGFLDYDGDGDLDLYLVNAFTGYTAANRLFRNDGGRFTEVAESLGVADGGNGRGLAIGDYDQDGDPDIYVASRMGGTGSELYRNEVREGRGFIPAGVASGLSASSFAVAAAWGDYDGDGDLDLFVADEGGPGRLWRNEGQRATATGNGLSQVRFSLVDSSQGAPAVSRSVGAAWGDYDDDGDLDLLVTGIDVNGTGDEIYHNRGAGGFLAVGELLGLRRSSQGRGLVTADLDNDGRLDLLVADFAHTTLYRNGVSPAHWLEVVLRGTGSNRDAVGARIEVYAQGRRQVRQQQPAIGYASQGPPWVHFGLGSATRVDSLLVWWPDKTRTVQRGVQANRRLTLTQPGQSALAGKPATGRPISDGLQPAYPNPFNGSVVIPFVLAAPQAVQVAVYNAAGQRVRVLSTGSLEAGGHRLVWDGADEQGHAAASGVYLYRLATTDRQQTRRLLLLR